MPYSEKKLVVSPWGDGSLINYMHEFIRPNANRPNAKGSDGYETIVRLLEILSQRCGPSNLGHDGYQNGKAGLDIRGFLDSEQVRDLRLALSGRSWSVTAEEAIDGGMRDVSRNLIAILRAAETTRCWRHTTLAFIIRTIVM